MNVLIAEDDLTTQVILETLVTAWGYTPVIVSDGQQAWDTLQQPDAPRLLLLDWEMPHISGLTLCQKLTQHVQAIPFYIILLTSHAETNRIVEGLSAGANDFISKPFDKAELQARLQVGRRMLELQGALFETQQKLAYEATHDALTGLLNRRAVLEALHHLQTQSIETHTPLTVAIVDIDHFKRINDQYGHPAGDEVLEKVAKVLQQAMPAGSCVGRLGGEEFLIATVADAAHAADHLEVLRAEVEAIPLLLADQRITVTVSIGFMSAQIEDATHLDALMAQADQALYRAKERGRNQVVMARTAR